MHAPLTCTVSCGPSSCVSLCVFGRGIGAGAPLLHRIPRGASASLCTSSAGGHLAAGGSPLWFHALSATLPCAPRAPPTSAYSPWPWCGRARAGAARGACGHQIRDLLGKDPKSQLELKENLDTGVYVKDLTMFVVKSAIEIDQVMQSGKKNRSVGATLMNAGSSRSHSIFTIVVECAQESTDGSKPSIRVGRSTAKERAGFALGSMR